MKVKHAFGGIFPVTEKVIYTFLYYYVIDNLRYILEKNEVPIRNFCHLFLILRNTLLTDGQCSVCDEVTLVLSRRFLLSVENP